MAALQKQRDHLVQAIKDGIPAATTKDDLENVTQRLEALTDHRNARALSYRKISPHAIARQSDNYASCWVQKTHAAKPLSTSEA